MPVAVRPPNDPGQYDDLVDEWWDPAGSLAPLHWLAVARGALVPPASRPEAVLVDVGCGGGLTAPHVAGKGYHHVGVDVGAIAASVARDHGVLSVQGDAHHLPVATATADVVVAGEILEHVTDLPTVVGEIARVLRPGGTIVLDTLADTRSCRFLMVTLAERVGVVPAGIHDPALFVAPARLVRLFAGHGIHLRLSGLRPSLTQGLAWLVGRRRDVTMRATRSTGIVYQGIGTRVAT